MTVNWRSVGNLIIPTAIEINNIATELMPLNPVASQMLFRLSRQLLDVLSNPRLLGNIFGPAVAAWLFGSLA